MLNLGINWIRVVRRVLRWGGLGLCLAVLVTGGLAADVGTNTALQVGDVFPNLANFELEGAVPSIKGKVAVVDFWASWCGPCGRTFPTMEELHRRYGKRGLVIVTINEDRVRAAMDLFLKENPVTFSVVRDAKHKLAAAINVPALPTSYVLDAAGRIRVIQPGSRTARDSKAFIKVIEALLDEESKNSKDSGGAKGSKEGRAP